VFLRATECPESKTMKKTIKTITVADRKLNTNRYW
jgi:hypothetical protein